MKGLGGGGVLIAFSPPGEALSQLGKGAWSTWEKTLS